MGWCSECLDSSTTDGYIDYDLGGQYKYLDVAIGELSNSPESTGTFRFDIKLDGSTVKSYILGLYSPVTLKNFPINNAERLTFAVRNVGKPVNAYTGFGDPTVHN